MSTIKNNTTELLEILYTVNNLPSVDSGGTPPTEPPAAEPIIEPLSVTENGTYTAPNGVDGYSPVVVNVRVPEGSITPSGTKKIAENGTHNVAEYEFADVNVPIPDGYIIPSGTKTITENGTHDAKEFAEVDVNVPIPDGYIVPSGTLEITSNGEHNVAEYKKVNVLIPSGGMTGLGADIYVVIQGQLIDFFTFVGNAFPDFGIVRESTVVAVVDAPPELPSSIDVLPAFLVTKSDGIKYLRYSGMWLPFATFASAAGMEIPDYGWISQSELDEMDYTDYSRWGFYAVQRLCNPFVERNITEYSGNEKIVGGGTFTRSFILTSVNLPNATSIGDDAFYNCLALTSINLPNATSIGNSAFAYCYSLTSIDIPNATSIGDDAFYECAALTSIDLPNATRMGNYAFAYCYALTSVNLPNATSIGSSAFYECAALTSIDLPNATRMGNYAFAYCYALTSVNLPNAERFDNCVFQGCSAITTLDLPRVTTISDATFNGCRSLTSLILRANQVCVLNGSRVFANTPIADGNGYIYVPSSLVDRYKNATNWAAVADQIRAIEDYPEITGG